MRALKWNYENGLDEHLGIFSFFFYMNDYVFDTWGIGVGEYSHAEYRQNSKRNGTF